MAGTKKRVVILKNFKSDTIEQAILVLKDGCKVAAQDGIVAEAEKIIDDYIYKEKYQNIPEETPKPVKEKSSRTDMYLNIIMVACGIGIVYAIFKIF